MSYLSGPRDLPDQPVRSVDPELERLAHVVVGELIARLNAEPAVPATSLLDNLADRLQQAAALRRLGVVRRAPVSKPDEARGATPRHRGSRQPLGEQRRNDA